ncbi:MAG: SDR family oxidoreductase, partial [Coxiellaceae bacterium]|nr:SDR family oxidoreductase [Coxiellaceae bacterium]
RRLITTTIEHYGQLDYLINNAGISQVIAHDDLDAATDEIFHRMWQTNVMGTWYLCRAAMPHLEKSGHGKIINISSVAGVRAAGSSIPYAVSKAAVNHLTKLLANTFGPNVSINAIAPGLIRTPRTEGWDDITTYFTEKTAKKAAGKVDDIAQCALGILKTDYLTGQVIVCDGGFLLG